MLRLLAVGAVTVGAILVVVLGQRVAYLSEHVFDLRDRLTAPRAGDYVPEFVGEDLTGGTVTVGTAPAGGRQVLFQFSTTCEYSLASLPAVNELARVAGRAPVPTRLHGLSLDDRAATREYVEEQGLEASVLTFPDLRTRRLFRAGRVPQILVVDQEGLILYARTGVLNGGAAFDSIADLLGEAP